jgi:CRP/FNR family transcriptional regulator, cyclic AMP receptor protein
MMMTAREPIDPATVRQVEIFRTLDDAQVRQICVLLKERRYRKGEVICHQGDPGDCLYIVGVGRVRIYLISADGREATLRIYGRGTAFGEFAVLDGGPRSTYAAALDDVTTFVLYRDDFLGLLRANFELVQHVIAMLTERLRYTTSYSENLAFLSAPARVAALLTQLAEVEAADRAVVRLELTQQELADFANTTREWVNRSLRDFTEQGLVRLERGAVVVLDRDGLRRIT